MLDYEEELKKFKPSLEVDDIENAVYQEDLTDMTDLLKQVMDQKKYKDNGGYKWNIRKRSYISQTTGITTV